MGVSILSLVEIIYYFTLRLACNFNYWRTKNVKAKKNPILCIDHVPEIIVNFSSTKDKFVRTDKFD